MERRFKERLEELSEDAVLDSRIPDGMLDRLEHFVKPFAAIMETTEQEQHLWEYVSGLFSDVKRKNTESIAYFHDQDRQALQKFIGQSLWDDGLLLEELARQVSRDVGEADGVIVFDPSGFRETGQGVGRCSATVVWPSGKNRKLPSGCLPGIRFSQGTRLGGRAFVSEQGVGEG